MSRVDERLNKRSDLWWIAVGGIAVLIVAAIAVPNLERRRVPADQFAGYAPQQSGADSFEARIHPPATNQNKAYSPNLASFSAAPAKNSVAAAMDRKMVRNSSVDLIVRKPGEAAENIRALAEEMGGFLVSSQVRGGDGAGPASLIIRVPAAQFEEARTRIRKLGLRVESERVDAQDVTRQYVDQDANLRNLRSEEAQYLTILKQAHTVKDTLEVSEKLSEVRGEIEQQQAEFDALSKQIETVAITVSLRAESEAQVFGLQWRPLYQMKLALHDGLDAVAGYAWAMISILFYLPAVLLWTGTIIVCGAMGWKVLRWAGRAFFAWPKQSPAQNG